MTLSFKNKVFLLSRRWTHHASHSGYDILGKYIGTALARKPISNLLLPDYLFFKMTKKMRAYDRTGVNIELLVLKHMALHKDCIYHFLYGESTYNYIGLLNGWRGHKIVATYHKPPKYFEEMVRATIPINRLSSVFIVGQNQYDSFRTILPENRIRYLPHPVDTSFFTPPESFNDRLEDLCLFVGAHLRDYQTLRAVIEKAWVVSPNIRFMLIVHPFFIREFEGLVGNYEIVSDITEADLLSLYRRAALLVMPLEETTANNTVLEALSCGLPMVVSEIGAIRDYASEECALFVPPYNPDAMLETILSLLKSNTNRREMSRAARQLALQFDWEEIVKDYMIAYAEILNND